MRRLAQSFYVVEGDRFESTELTRGPWSPEHQHAGPPAALIGRQLELLPDAAEFHLGRITFEILRPVPIAPLRVDTRIERPGRRVQMIEATLTDEAGERLIEARAWRIRIAPADISAAVRPAQSTYPEPGQGAGRDFFPTGEGVGYHTAMEYRFVEGAFLEPGPAIAWMRMRHSLVEGEEPTPLQRVLAAADTGNGISATLDWRRHLFINVDLSVHLERLPEGEWVGLDAVTLPEPNGVGTADTILFDQRGRIGRALQTLLISER